MIGIALLFVAVFLYFRPKYRYISYFLYLSFMMGMFGGFNLWTDEILGSKNGDCAIIYTFIVSIYLLIESKWKMPKDKNFRFLRIFYWFLLASVLFSYVYYGLTLYQILQAGRKYLLFMALPIFLRVSAAELSKLVRFLFYMCLLTSVLYIGQSVLGRAIMPYRNLVQIDGSTGLPRYYNIPANVTFFLALTFLIPNYFRKFRFNINVYRFIFFLAIICSLGRTFIVFSVGTIILSVVFTGRVKKMARMLVVMAILLVPLSDVIGDRFEKGDTSGDLSSILSGGYKQYQSDDGGTMLYRLAWVYERGEYLMHRPIGEKIFGMGLCSESQDWVRKNYDFKIGFVNDETGGIIQFDTGDISYGPLLVYLGFGGIIVYLLMIMGFFKYFWNNRAEYPIFPFCCAYILMLFVEGFSGTDLIGAGSFVLLFLFMAIRNKTEAQIVFC